MVEMKELSYQIQIKSNFKSQEFQKELSFSLPPLFAEFYGPQL